jgi:hypothetical protein
MFNKGLPEEIIRKIILYLPMNDLLSLCLSKLFFPCLLNSSFFFSRLHQYLLSTLCDAYSQQKNLFLLCTCVPIIIENEFYFSLDRSKILYFKKINKKKLICVPVFNEILCLFNSIFFSFNDFNAPTNKLKFKHLFMINNISKKTQLNILKQYTWHFYDD